MAAIEAPELRAAALARASRSPDSRVREVLRRSLPLVREARGATWESSDGEVRGYEVVLLVDGAALGMTQRSPALHDAVLEAVAAVAPATLGGSVVELRFAWGLAEHLGEAGYRGETSTRIDPSDPIALRSAAVGYLAANDMTPAARAMRDGEVELRGRRAVVHGVTPPAAVQAQEALSALLAVAHRR